MENEKDCDCRAGSEQSYHDPDHGTHYYLPKDLIFLVEHPAEQFTKGNLSIKAFLDVLPDGYNILPEEVINSIEFDESPAPVRLSAPGGVHHTVFTVRSPALMEPVPTEDKAIQSTRLVTIYKNLY